MRQILSTTTQVPSIVIMQGAYEIFCSPGTVETTAYDTKFGMIFVSPKAVTMATQEDWIKFQALVDAWRLERGAKSSITEAAMCPAYQSILGMGPDVVPLLLNQLRSEGDKPDHWFWALKAITGADPVSANDRGNLKRMAAAWLEWGSLQWYAW